LVGGGGGGGLGGLFLEQSKTGENWRSPGKYMNQTQKRLKAGQARRRPTARKGGKRMTKDARFPMRKLRKREGTGRLKEDTLLGKKPKTDARSLASAWWNLKGGTNSTNEGPAQ